MGWVTIGGVFYGDLPMDDPNKSERENLVAKQKAMKEQIEKSHPGMTEDEHEHS